jgi:hypothetical protein
MKTVTIWQRINTAFWLLIVLLLAGVVLALWVARARSEGLQRSDQLGAANDRIAYKMVLLSDTVRGLLEERAREKAPDRDGDGPDGATASHRIHLSQIPRPAALGG